MIDDVAVNKKKERLAALINVQTKITKEHYASMVGKNWMCYLQSGSADGKTSGWGRTMGAKEYYSLAMTPSQERFYTYG